MGFFLPLLSSNFLLQEATREPFCESFFLPPLMQFDWLAPVLVLGMRSQLLLIHATFKGSLFLSEEHVRHSPQFWMCMWLSLVSFHTVHGAPLSCHTDMNSVICMLSLSHVLLLFRVLFQGPDLVHWYIYLCPYHYITELYCLSSQQR